METFDTYFDKAIRCYQDNNLKLAIHNFSKCLELDPENYAVYNNRGLMYYNIDNFGMAIQDFNHSLRLNPNNLDGYYNRGLAYQQFGEYDKALEDFNIVKANSSNYDNLEEEIQKTLDLKSGKSISLNFFSDISHDGGDPEVAFNGGKFYASQGDYNKAVECFSNAINYRKQFEDAYFERANCYANLKQFDKAISDYLQLENIVEDKSIVKANIALIYEKLKQNDLALDYFSQAIELNPYNSNNYYFRGRHLLSNQKYDQAIFDLSKAIELNPSDPNAHFQMGVAHFDTKRYTESLKYAIKANDLRPNNSAINYILGRIYFILEDRINSERHLLLSKQLGHKLADEFLSTHFSS